MANKIEDLYLIKSLNYEKLSGGKKGLEPVRVNDKFRIEFISSLEGEEPNTITICEIVELVNHYSKTSIIMSTNTIYPIWSNFILGPN